jgi:hypothetical protein
MMWFLISVVLVSSEADSVFSEEGEGEVVSEEDVDMVVDEEQVVEAEEEGKMRVCCAARAAKRAYHAPLEGEGRARRRETAWRRGVEGKYDVVVEIGFRPLWDSEFSGAIGAWWLR